MACTEIKFLEFNPLPDKFNEYVIFDILENVFIARDAIVDGKKSNYFIVAFAFFVLFILLHWLCKSEKIFQKGCFASAVDARKYDAAVFYRFEVPGKVLFDFEV